MSRTATVILNDLLKKYKNPVPYIPQNKPPQESLPAEAPVKDAVSYTLDVANTPNVNSVSISTEVAQETLGQS